MLEYRRGPDCKGPGRFEGGEGLRMYPTFILLGAGRLQSIQGVCKRCGVSTLLNSEAVLSLFPQTKLRSRLSPVESRGKCAAPGFDTSEIFMCSSLVLVNLHHQPAHSLFMRVSHPNAKLKPHQSTLFLYSLHINIALYMVS